MEGIEIFIFFVCTITFGPPIIFLIVGMSKWKKDRNSAKVYVIIGTVWLIIGGGACLSILYG